MIEASGEHMQPSRRACISTDSCIPFSAQKTSHTSQPIVQSMKGVLFLLISTILSALRGVEARAVDTKVTTFLTSNASSSNPLDTSNTTISLESCTDMNICRSLQQCPKVMRIGTFSLTRNHSFPKRQSLLFSEASALVTSLLAHNVSNGLVSWLFQYYGHS